MHEPQLPPKRFIWQRLDAIEYALHELKRGIEEMAKTEIVTGSEFDQIKYQVGSLSEAVTELEARVMAIEKHNSTINWVARQLGTIVLALVIGYIANMLF